MKGLISASMMCANLIDLKETLKIFEEEKVDYLHIDVMDGEFVPNFGLGVDYIRCLRELTDIPLDIHLMVRNPEYKLQWIGIQQNDIVSVHFESTFQVQRALDWLDQYGCKKFLAINPATPIYSLEEVLDYIDGVNLLMVNPGFAGQQIVGSTLKKADKLRQFLIDNHRDNLIFEVDGNISPKHAKILREKGADMFVTGTSSVFRGNVNDYRHNLNELRTIIG